MPHQYKIICIIIMSLLMLSCGEVSEDAAHIQLGTGNVLYTYSDTEYQVPLSVHVTDIDGNAVSGAEVKIRVVPVSYRKGNYVWLDDTNTVTANYADAVKWSATVSQTCSAEDINNNAVLDNLEDVNGNGVLDPSSVSVTASHPENIPTLDLSTNTITTGDSGSGYFSLIYPESVANWVDVKVTATTSVNGTESSQTVEISLLASIADMEDIDIAPPGGSNESPYGVANVCTDPN